MGACHTSNEQHTRGAADLQSALVKLYQPRFRAALHNRARQQEVLWSCHMQHLKLCVQLLRDSTLDWRGIVEHLARMGRHGMVLRVVCPLEHSGAPAAAAVAAANYDRLVHDVAAAVAAALGRGCRPVRGMPRAGDFAVGSLPTACTIIVNWATLSDSKAWTAVAAPLPPLTGITADDGMGTDMRMADNWAWCTATDVLRSRWSSMALAVQLTAAEARLPAAVRGYVLPPSRTALPALSASALSHT